MGRPHLHATPWLPVMLVAPWLTSYVAPWLPSLLPTAIVPWAVTVRLPGTLTPTHSTGIPDDRVRRVRLLADQATDASLRCHEFYIEQDIGGADTGSVLWSGSVVLAALLRRRAAAWGLRAGSSVLELGAGLGLVSITASCLGASVVATDGDEAILPMMSRNVLRNLGGSDGEVDVRRLWWGDVPAAQTLGTFDFVVGSDLVYGSDSFHVGDDARLASFAQLLCTMWLLSDANTTLVLAYRERRAVESQFFDGLWEGFEPERPPESLALAGVPEANGVRLYTFRRRQRLIAAGQNAALPSYCTSVSQQ
eukprot:Transcript_12642.p1 GENE.Transcript_12642~~Transcript_12642.p1  ORF type:complete len:336 (-),score=95.20 Transcript_12642:1179-2102(-)